MKCTVTILGVVLLLSGCNQPRRTSPAERDKIEQASGRFWAAFMSANTDSVTAQVTEDFTLMSPGASDVRGRAALREMASQVFSALRISEFKVHTREIDVCDSTAYELATYSETTIQNGKQPQTADGRYLLVWKLQRNGSWLVYRNLYNHVTP